MSEGLNDLVKVANAERAQHKMSEGLNDLAKAANVERAKYKPGQLAAKRMKVYQNSTRLFIPRRRFLKLIRQIDSTLPVFDNSRQKRRYQKKACDLLQKAMETYIVQIVRNAALCAKHAQRESLTPADINMVRTIMPNSNVRHRFVPKL